MTIGIVSPLIYSKVTGKTVGVPGSIAHVMTNNKLSKQDKVKTAIVQTQESGKDVAGLFAKTASVGATAALATGCSNKIQSALHGSKKSVAEFLDNIVLKGFDGVGKDVSLKNVIKNIPAFQKFNGLPTAAKAGIIASIAAFGILVPFVSHSIAAKEAYIEGKNENSLPIIY